MNTKNIGKWILAGGAIIGLTWVLYKKIGFIEDSATAWVDRRLKEIKSDPRVVKNQSSVFLSLSKPIKAEGVLSRDQILKLYTLAYAVSTKEFQEVHKQVVAIKRRLTLNESVGAYLHAVSEGSQMKEALFEVAIREVAKSYNISTKMLAESDLYWKMKDATYPLQKLKSMLAAKELLNSTSANLSDPSSSESAISQSSGSPPRPNLSLQQVGFAWSRKNALLSALEEAPFKKLLNKESAALMVEDQLAVTTGVEEEDLQTSSYSKDPSILSKSLMYTKTLNRLFPA